MPELWDLEISEGGVFFRKTAFSAHFEEVQNTQTISDTLDIDSGSVPRSYKHILNL